MKNWPDEASGRRWRFVDVSVVLAEAEDRVVDEAVAALVGGDQPDQHRYSAEERRRDVRQLFRLVLRCVREGSAESISTPSGRIAAHCFAAGTDLAEVQGEFNALAEALWHRADDSLAGEQRFQAIRLVNGIVGAGKDALARTYVTLADDARNRPSRPAAPQQEDCASTAAAEGAGPEGPVDDIVRTAMVGQVGIITLDDRDRRNAIGARVAAGIVAALGSLRAQDARVIVLRAAPGMRVWSAGHDIDELPRGRRDPLGYNDPLEELLRAVRAFPAPVVAMVHGTVWGGALDLVLSCDLVVADETAAFAITPANLGLPYNITGLLHFLGRLPINMIKEMFFTATPVDARTAREWRLVNHLVPWDRLESFTLELAATMATKSPLAIAVIKEQLNVLSDYQPIAAQVYERVQGLRRQAYDSSDYLEGLNAFAEKRPPMFRGTLPSGR
jgi:methylmalonyl-CoA decarboxylase